MRILERAILLVTSLAALASLATSCAGEDVVVADLAPAASSAQNPPVSGPDGGKICALNSDCQDDEFCSKPSCDSPMGECETRPFLCDAPELPSCGCDGVTYWKDCLRKQHGIAASEPGQCLHGLPCDDEGMMPCPDHGSCARLLVGVMCDPHPAGTCWSVPPDCGPSPPEDSRWTPCVGAPTGCFGTCDAIKMQMPFRMADPQACFLRTHRENSTWSVDCRDRFSHTGSPTRTEALRPLSRW